MKSERGAPRVLRARFQGISGHDAGRFRKSIKEHAATHRLVVSTPAFREACLFQFRNPESAVGPYSRTICRRPAAPERRGRAFTADSTEHPEGPPR